MVESSVPEATHTRKLYKRKFIQINFVQQKKSAWKMLNFFLFISQKLELLLKNGL